MAAPSAAPRAGTVASAAPRARAYQGGAVDMNQILEERDACGVGFIASLKGERTHKTISRLAHRARLHGAPRRVLRG